MPWSGESAVRFRGARAEGHPRARSAHDCLLEDAPPSGDMQRRERTPRAVGGMDPRAITIADDRVSSLVAPNRRVSNQTSSADTEAGSVPRTGTATCLLTGGPSSPPEYPCEEQPAQGSIRGMVRYCPKSSVPSARLPSERLL